MFNEYGVTQMIKLRQEEADRIANEAWKYSDFSKDTLFQIVVKKFKMKFDSKKCGRQNQCICEC